MKWVNYFVKHSQASTSGTYSCFRIHISVYFLEWMKFHDSLSLNHLNQTACNMAQKLSFFARVSRFHFHSISLCENVNYGSDSLAALSPSFGRDFHIHYIISGTMIIAVILSVSYYVFFSLQLFQAYQLFLYTFYAIQEQKDIHCSNENIKTNSKMPQEN